MVGIFRQTPEYPPRALQRGVGGCVKLEISVTEDGAVENVRVIESSNEIFDRASVAAVQRWRYAPRLVDDLPVRVDGIRTTLTFELEGAGRARAPECQIDVPISR
jgi:protein TonB